jgi:hypothetical protein
MQQVREDMFSPRPLDETHLPGKQSYEARDFFLKLASSKYGKTYQF